MKRPTIVARLLALAASALCVVALTSGWLERVSAQVGGAFDHTWLTIDGGGSSPSSGGIYSLRSTVGQPDAGQASGGPFSLLSGFWGVADEPLPTLSMNDVTLAEGNSGTTSFVFTVTLSTPSNAIVTVNAQTVADTAVAPGDFTAVASTPITFPALSTTQTFTVLVNGDVQNEPDEQFSVTLSGAANATIADGQGVGTIQNDDALPSLSIADVSLAEGNSGTTSFVFTVTLSPSSGKTVTVTAHTAADTALAGSDYTATGPQTLTFTPGQTTQTFTVLVVGDTAPEADETFLVDLASPANATILDGQATGIIVNDDGSAPTATPTVTSTPTAIATSTDVPTATNTAVAIATSTLTATATASASPTATSAASATPTVTTTIPGALTSTPTRTFTPTATPTPVPPPPNSKPNDDDEDRSRRSRDDHGSEGDRHTEGNVVEVRPDVDPPVIVIANKDGLVELRLFGEARHALASVEVGQYVVATGEKENEQLYNVDDLSIE